MHIKAMTRARPVQAASVEAIFDVLLQFLTVLNQVTSVFGIEFNKDEKEAT